MSELSRRELSDSLSINKLMFYEPYIFIKQRRVRFTKGIHNTKVTTLDYIHFNLWEPIGVPSKRCAYYTIIDDFSKKLWVFLLKQENNVLPTFKEQKT